MKFVTIGFGKYEKEFVILQEMANIMNGNFYLAKNTEDLNETCEL